VVRKGTPLFFVNWLRYRQAWSSSRHTASGNAPEAELPGGSNWFGLDFGNPQRGVASRAGFLGNDIEVGVVLTELPLDS
jgi:hypothetical protein